MTDTATSGVGVRGNTPADIQRADQQQRSEERNRAKGTLSVPWVRAMAWLVLTIVTIYLVNVYEWTFSWALIVSTIILIGSWKLRQNVISKSKSRYKDVMHEVANVAAMVSATTIMITLLTASFTSRLAETVDSVEECVGGNEVSCAELRFNQRQDNTGSLVHVVPPAVWIGPIEAPPRNSPSPLRIDLGGEVACFSATGASVDLYNERSMNAFALIRSITDAPVEISYIKGSLPAMQAGDPRCAAHYE